MQTVENDTGTGDWPRNGPTPYILVPISNLFPQSSWFKSANSDSDNDNKQLYFTEKMIVHTKKTSKNN